jgi:NADH-ubiquinone oxidoreductase chain 5
MEGPTPVSALIHAATMVTAGVFLLARCSAIFEYCPTVLIIITIIGAFTAFFGATTALVQNDIKKVIAYSTCSQLGYMIFICGLSHYSIGIFHLFNHAFFKALLFLSAGAIIHAMNDEQDFRKMGGLRKILPFSYSAMVIGSFSLMGFPFLTGFYSKDAILEISFAKYTCISHFAYFMGSFTAFFTSFYSIRLIYLVFIVRTNSFKSIIKNAHEPSIRMYFPLIFLLFGSIFFGYFFKDMFIGLGTSFWGNAIFVLPINSFAIEGEFLPSYIKLLPNLFVCGGVFLGWLIYSKLQFSLFNLKTPCAAGCCGPKFIVKFLIFVVNFIEN